MEKKTELSAEEVEQAVRAQMKLRLSGSLLRRSAPCFLFPGWRWNLTQRRRKCAGLFWKMLWMKKLP